MNVCIDIQAAIGQGAGVGRYVRELLRHLKATETPQDHLAGFFFDFNHRGFHRAPAGLKLRPYHVLPGRMVQAMWKRISFPPFQQLAGPADVYHFPNFICPPIRKDARVVVTIHDVSFIRMPETTEDKNLAWLSSQIRKTVVRADAILTISEFSKREICDCLNVPEEKVFVTYPGLPEIAPASVDLHIGDVRHQLDLDKPYLLMVGTLEPRKNIPFLIKIWEALRDWDGELVLVGGMGWKTEAIMSAIQDSPRAVSIRHVSRVGDKTLAALYAGAELFVFPSRYEGFGFPPLEAMSRGLPVVAARNSSLPEVLGDAAEWVDGFDVETWADTIRRLLNESADSREKRIAYGRDRVTKFSWEDTAKQTWDVYRKVAEGKIG